MATKRKLGSIASGSFVDELPPSKSRRVSSPGPSTSSSEEDPPEPGESEAPARGIPDATLSDFESDDDGELPSLNLPERVSLPSRVISQPAPPMRNTAATTQPELSIDFSALGISSDLSRALKKMSIRTPTPVQAFCIPPLLAGRDCIGNAKTGSGKTVAFALPILQKLSLDPYGIFALVLTPTRELALQIGDQFAVLGVALGIHTAVIVGGMDMLSQALELNNRPHIVVATPGRLVDHLNSESGEWNLSRVKFLVLDEADRLLTDTFAPDLRAIFAALPPDRQTGLFTATITPKIEKLSDAPPRPGKQKPVIYRDTSTVETVDTLKQYFVICPSHVREVYLFYLLCHPPESIAHLRREAPAKVKARWKQRDEDDTPILFPPPTIVFVTHPRTAAYLTILLQHLGIPAAALHSYLSQRDRLSSLHSFRSSVSPVLVCTDVASRGLDIEDVGMVINWDMPMGKLRKRFLEKEKRKGKSEVSSEVAGTEGNEIRISEDEDEGGAEDYVHRVGRTARMGRGGVAVSFVTERKGDTVMVEKIEQRIKTRLEEMELPEAKVLIELNKVSVAKRTAKLNLENSNFGERQRINRKKGKNMSKQS